MSDTPSFIESRTYRLEGARVITITHNANDHSAEFSKEGPMSITAEIPKTTLYRNDLQQLLIILMRELPESTELIDEYRSTGARKKA